MIREAPWLPMAQLRRHFRSRRATAPSRRPHTRHVFEAPGYEQEEIWLTGSREAGWCSAGNVVVGGLIGRLIVDPITGAMWNLGPEAVGANLDPPDLLAAASLVATAPWRRVGWLMRR